MEDIAKFRSKPLYEVEKVVSPFIQKLGISRKPIEPPKDEDVDYNKAAFGYPVINFGEDPVDRLNSKIGKRVNFEEYDNTVNDAKDFIYNKYAYNWNKVQRQTFNDMENYYERKRQQNAFRIIDFSLTEGLRLQRNPISEAEQRK